MIEVTHVLVLVEYGDSFVEVFGSLEAALKAADRHGAVYTKDEFEEGGVSVRIWDLSKQRDGDLGSCCFDYAKSKGVLLVDEEDSVDKWPECKTCGGPVPPGDNEKIFGEKPKAKTKGKRAP